MKIIYMPVSKTIVATVVASSVLLSAHLWSQTAVPPTTTVTSGPATEVLAEENYVLQRLAPPSHPPFRSTLGEAAYTAAKQAAENASRLSRSRFIPEQAPITPMPQAPSGPPTLVFQNFNGASCTDGGSPPDTDGAVGHTHFVEITNSNINIWNKASPPALVKSVSQAQFFNYFTTGLFDGRAVYDPVWERWILTADAGAESSSVQRFFIAVSKTSDPTGAFFVYNINVSKFLGAGNVFDFPDLGFDQDSVIVTANAFVDGGPFLYGAALAIAKARLYNGLSFSVPFFTGLAGGVTPPIVLDQNAQTFLISAPTSASAFPIYAMTNSSHPGSTALVSSSITVPGYTMPRQAHQPGTTKTLDTANNSFLNHSTQNGNDLWQVHTIDYQGFPTPKFYRIDTSANSVKQSGIFHKSSTSDDFNASIAANSQGDIFVTWNATDAGNGINAQVLFSGKRNGDATIPNGGVVGFTSSTFYAPTAQADGQRWGDYSAVTIDPSVSTGLRAWLVNEKIDSQPLWGSRIMKVGF